MYSISFPNGVWEQFRQDYEENLKYAEPLSKQPFVRDVLKWSSITSRERFRPAQTNSLVFLDPADYLKKVTCPVLAIFGEKDTKVCLGRNC